MGFSTQEYWSGLSFPSPGDLSHPGIKPTSPVSPVLAGRFFTTEPPGNPQNIQKITFIYIPSSCPSTLSFSHIRTCTQTLPVMGAYEFPIHLRAHVGTGPFILYSTFAHLQTVARFRNQSSFGLRIYFGIFRWIHCPCNKHSEGNTAKCTLKSPMQFSLLFSIFSSIFVILYIFIINILTDVW